MQAWNIQMKSIFDINFRVQHVALKEMANIYE
jgi:hypothetical protein